MLARFGLVGKNSRVPFGAIRIHFSMVRKNEKSFQNLSIFLGGPMDPIHPVWALAAIQPRWGNRLVQMVKWWLAVIGRPLNTGWRTTPLSWIQWVYMGPHLFLDIYFSGSWTGIESVPHAYCFAQSQLWPNIFRSIRISVQHICFCNSEHNASVWEIWESVLCLFVQYGTWRRRLRHDQMASQASPTYPEKTLHIIVLNSHVSFTNISNALCSNNDLEHCRYFCFM